MPIQTKYTLKLAVFSSILVSFSSAVFEMAGAFVSHFFIEPPNKKRLLNLTNKIQCNGVFLNTPNEDLRREIQLKEKEIENLKAQLRALREENNKQRSTFLSCHLLLRSTRENNFPVDSLSMS